MRLADGEGMSHPPILNADMLETMRNLVQTEAARKAASRNAEMEEMRKRQAKTEEELRRKHRCGLQINVHRDLNNLWPRI